MKNRNYLNQSKLAFPPFCLMSVVLYMILTTTSLNGQAPIIQFEILDTVNTEVSNLVRRETGIVGIRNYEIGDMVNGGIIFWLDASGEHGLIAAPSDQSDGIVWSLDLNLTGAIAGNTALGVGGATGAGATNTSLIVSANANGLTAAKICSDLLINSYGGWYMPSKGELFLMFTNLHQAGLGNFTNDAYWSSTEATTNSAWRQLFIGGQFVSNKGNIGRLRAIRAF